MHPTLKAILARFNGNAVDAFHYCTDMAANNPTLFDEYTYLAEELIKREGGEL